MTCTRTRNDEWFISQFSQRPASRVTSYSCHKAKQVSPELVLLRPYPDTFQIRCRKSSISVFQIINATLQLGEIQHEAMLVLVNRTDCTVHGTQRWRVVRGT